MAATSNDVANEALQLTGDNAPTVGGQKPTWDGSTAGIALSKLYSAVVSTVARQGGWDPARNTVALASTGNTPTNPAYTQEYSYPSNGIEVWQLMPPALSDPNNPLPVNWNVANTLVSGTQTKVIQCNLPGSLGSFNNTRNA